MAFGFYKTATVNHLQCGTVNSSNWPLRLAVTDADLKTVGNGGSVQSASGFDIRPYSDAGLTTALDFELVAYTPTTGLLEMYVRLPTLSVSVDVVVYLAFGDAALTTNGSTTTTWDANFVGVYHFGAGGSLTLTDSSQKAAHGSNGGATLAAGYVGGGAQMTSTQYIDIPGLVNYFASKVAATVQVTVFPATTANTNVVFTVGGLDYILSSSVATPFYRLSIGIRDGVHSGLAVLAETTDNGYTEGVWNRLVGVVDGAADVVSIWRDGVVKGTSSGFTFDNFDPAGANFVRIGFSTSNTFPAIYDEVRISDSVRSPSWLIADENNQKPSSTFLTWGTKVASGGAAVVPPAQTYIVVPA
jgi:biopolymer transport protein ExbB